MNTLVHKASKKALQSPCRFKVSAIACNKKGDIIGIKHNTVMFDGRGGSHHAERRAIQTWGKGIKTLLICRVNKSGALLPIEPCANCAKLAEKYSIKILTIEDRERFEAYAKKKKAGILGL